MLSQRNALDFSGSFQNGDYVDLIVNASDGSESGSFNAHRVILCAASGFFQRAVNKGPQQEAKVNLYMNPKLFKYYLDLVYEGMVIIEEEDLAGFRVALELLEDVCLPRNDPDRVKEEVDDQEPREKKPKAKIKPPTLENLDDVKIPKFIKKDPLGSGFICLVCKKKISTRLTAFNHVRGVHVGRKDIPCSFCEEKFKTKQNLNSHVHVYHKMEKLAES